MSYFHYQSDDDNEDNGDACHLQTTMMMMTMSSVHLHNAQCTKVEY